MQHIISILVINEPGVLTRISSLFSRRNFNIHSLAVGTTQDPAVSRITIVIIAEQNRLDQILAQINKSPVVLAVELIDSSRAISSCLALFKIHSNLSNQQNILNIARSFNPSILLPLHDSIIFQIAGNSLLIQNAIDALSPFGIQELIQSGLIALNRDESIHLNQNPPFVHKNLL